MPDELRVFGYIHGMLRSPGYLRTYAPFLQIGFSRISPKPTASCAGLKWIWGMWSNTVLTDRAD